MVAMNDTPTSARTTGAHPLPERGQEWRERLDLGRLARLRSEIARADCGAGLFYDPVNIRYATGTSNMQVYALHNPCRYVFVPVEGPVVLFEFKGCGHLSKDCVAVNEVRDAVPWYFSVSGPRTGDLAGLWAAEILELVAAHGGGNRRIAIDRVDPQGLDRLRESGCPVVDGREVAERARRIKTPEEVDALRDAVAVCQTGIVRMMEATEPGMTENAIWSVLHETNIRMGGEWIETRLFSSGPRTNPWYQEASNRRVEAGDMVSLDSDLIGPMGYSADISRSWIVDGKTPSGEQRTLYGLAFEQVMRNQELFRPGATFGEIAGKAFALPGSFSEYQIPAVAHGVGLVNEYPIVLHAARHRERGHEGMIEAGMVFCIESYAGKPGGTEGVKLEQQILVKEDGIELLSDMPFETELL